MEGAIVRKDKTVLRLADTRAFGSGVVVNTYPPVAT